MSLQYVGTARPGASNNNVSYTGTAGSYGPIGAETYKVRVLVTTDAYVTLDGTTPSNAAGVYMVAYNAEYFTTTPGQTVKAVQVSSAGTLCVTECL